MADKTIKCKTCGVDFMFSDRDQAFYKEKGYSDPQSCRDCRAKRKAGQGQDGQSNFKPKPKRY